MTMSLDQRFQDKVRIDPCGCRLWTAATNAKGYGVMRIDGKNKLAHHVAWFLEHGVWPKMLLHSCDTPACTEIDHLSEGDHKRNMAEAMDRGLYPRGGETHFSSKLSDDEIEEILWLKRMGARVNAIAAAYSVGHSRISQICSKGAR